MATTSATGSGQTVLITGASSGIGFQLARLFAADGYRLRLAALATDQIQQAENLLRQEFPQADLRFLALDLSRPEGPYQLYDALRGEQIDVLVNDAGYGQLGAFAETNLDKELSMINLNVSALVALTKLYLREMLGRKSGKILQVGSVAGFMPNPLLSVYGATKAFVRMFTEAIQNEVEGSGVTITLLCPPATDTNFFQVADMENAKEVQEGRAKGNLRSAEDVAKDGYEGLLAGTARVMSGLQATTVPFMASMMSDAQLAAISRKNLEPQPAEPGAELKQPPANGAPVAPDLAKKSPMVKTVKPATAKPAAPKKTVAGS